jgi:hypothetical protein
MTVSEAGRKGGITVRDERGHAFYEEIGKKGGQKVRELIERGKSRSCPRPRRPAHPPARSVSGRAVSSAIASWFTRDIGLSCPASSCRLHLPELACRASGRKLGPCRESC